MNFIPKSQYLIDANVFIQAKNFHYRFEFCQSFWDWIIQAHHANIVFSIDKVKKELKKGKIEDLVRIWINDKLPNDFFLPDIKDNSVIPSYIEIMQWINSDTHYTPQAKKEFAREDVADAFLIAVARTYGYTIVTHEKGNTEAKKRVLIPDAAKVFKVESIMIYDLLSQYAENNFSLKNIK